MAGHWHLQPFGMLVEAARSWVYDGCPDAVEVEELK